MIGNAAVHHLQSDGVSGDRGRLFRQFLLLLAMLVEAGMPIFPRIPLTGLLFVLSLVAALKRGGVDRRTLGLFVLPVLIAAEMLLFHPGDTLEMIASRFINFCSAILIVDMYAGNSAKYFVWDLKPILFLMALQAIGTMVLGTLAEDIFSSVLLDGIVYKTIGFIFTFHYMATDTFVKADGLFFERGVFQLFLNIYLYISLFVLRSKGDALIAVLGILSTWSTTGVVTSVLIFVLAFIVNSRRDHRATFGTVLFVVMLLPALVLVAFENVSDKLYGSGASSATARAFDLESGMAIISEYPVFGLGFSNEAYADALRKQSILYLPNAEAAERPQSNGIMRLFITIGVPLGLLFILGMFRSPLIEHPAVVGTVVFLSLLSEAIVYCPFVLVLIFSGLVRKGHAPSGVSLDMGVGGRRKAV